MKVEFSDQAKADLVTIGDYIARDSPRRALEFIGKPQEQARLIGEMPTAFPLMARYERYGIRWRPFGNYLIFYGAESDRIYVVHIVHGATDYEAILFDA